MLRVLKHLKHSLFDPLAQSWLARGASAFYITDGKHVLASWPEDANTLTSDLSVPIERNGVVSGMLHVVGDKTRAGYCRLEADALLIAQMLRLEYELDELTEEMVETQDQLVALYDLTRALRNNLSLDEVLNISLEKTLRMLHIPACGIVVTAGDIVLIRQVPAPVLDNADLLKLNQELQPAGNAQVLHEGDPRLPTAINELLYAPMEVKGHNNAGLYLFNKPTGFLSPDIKLAGAIAEQVGATIENVLLHAEALARTRAQTEMELARQVQLRLLPRTPPAISGLDIAAGSAPALQVGGDFFDFITDGKPLTFIVGDVSGKGMPAALIMSMTRTMMRSVAKVELQATPLDIMAYTNAGVYDDFTEVAMFATVFVGQYLPDSELLTYANAGHSPVIYCPTDGAARLLEADGTAIGVLTECLCTNQQIRMQPGDVLVVATDGFSEAFNTAGEMFGYQQLLELVKSCAHQSAEEIVRILFDTVKAFAAGRPQDDDQTVIVLKRVHP